MPYMITEVFFDVETKNLFSDVGSYDPGALGVSIVSAYRRVIPEPGAGAQGELRSFWEKDFQEFWPWLQTADRVIGFNSVKFDVAALQPYTSINLSKLKHFDMLEEVKKALGHRLSLDSLAKDTLGSGKIDVGTNAVKYWNAGDPESLGKLQKYCEMDVIITKDLYDYVMRNKHLKFTDKWNNPTTFQIDFSYPARVVADTRQIGLF